MDNRIDVVKVDAGNAHELIRLIVELADYENLEPPSMEARERLVWDATTDPPRFEAFLAMVDGQAAGYVVYYFTYSTFLARPSFFLEDIYVSERFRKMKVGSALFRHCVQVAKDRGCGRMEWAVLDWNVRAMAFYQSQGGRPVSEWMFYRLKAESFDDVLSRTP